MKNQELTLFKESGLIECEGISSALQRKLYNFLLFHAKKTYYYKDEEYWDSAGFDGKDTANNFANYLGLRSNEFEIQIKELVNFFGSEINEAYALELVHDLFVKEIEFNILKKDKYSEWEKGRRLSHAITEFEFFPRTKVLKYSLPSPVFKVLGQESDLPFAKINLLSLLRLRSKFSIILYEIFQDYADAPKIPKIPLEKIKKLFGLRQGYAFCDIDRRCLKPAIDEINKTNDIPFSASYEVCRRGQTPVAIQFKITKKNREINNNNDLNEKSMTPSQVNSVYLTGSHTLDGINKQNQEVNDNNMTEINKWKPTEELRKFAEKYLLEHPDSPQAKILKTRYILPKLNI